MQSDYPFFNGRRSKDSFAFRFYVMAKFKKCFYKDLKKFNELVANKSNHYQSVTTKVLFNGV